LGSHLVRPDASRDDLRDELQPHARVALAVGLPVRVATDARDLRLAVRCVQAARLALTNYFIEFLFTEVPSTTSLDQCWAPENRHISENDARYYDYSGSKSYRNAKAIEIGDQSPAFATIDHYKKGFSSSSLVINEVVLEGVFSEVQLTREGCTATVRLCDKSA
jgi:hypothetical protein